MNTITNQITASFSSHPEAFIKPEFDKDFSTIQDLRDYCETEFGFVHLESFTLNGVCYQYLDQLPS